MAYSIPTENCGCGPHWTKEEFEAFLHKVWLKRQERSSLSELTNLPNGDSDGK